MPTTEREACAPPTAAPTAAIQPPRHHCHIIPCPSTHLLLQAAVADGLPQHHVVAKLSKGIKVGAHGAGEDNGLLGDDRQAAAQLLQGQAGDVHAVGNYRAALQIEHAVERQQQGGLAGAGAADDAHLREGEGGSGRGRTKVSRQGGRQTGGTQQSPRPEQAQKSRQTGTGHCDAAEQAQGAQQQHPAAAPTFSPDLILKDTPRRAGGRWGAYFMTTPLKSTLPERGQPEGTLIAPVGTWPSCGRQRRHRGGGQQGGRSAGGHCWQQLPACACLPLPPATAAGANQPRQSPNP